MRAFHHSILLCLFMSLLFVSCGGQEKEITVQSIAISQPSVEIEIGETLTLKATVSPSNASYDGLTWTSTTPKVASVSASGLVTAISEGNTTITAMAGGRTASCVITVVKGFVAVTSISLNQMSLEMVERDSEMLTASILPDDATDKTVTWLSSNEAVATVKDGMVTAIKEGEATVSAKAGDVTSSCKVSVRKKVIAVELIELDKAELVLIEGDSETLTATVKPDDATDKSVFWKSTNESIATVDNNGKVIAVKDGETTITATAGEKSASCKVVVQKKKIAVESIELNIHNLKMIEGDSETLSVTIKPEDATDKTVLWSSSDAGVAAISDSGTLTAVARGVATITVKTAEGGHVATCDVTVKSRSDTGPFAYVEMGDGLKWATMNVGASSEKDYGSYFAWAETDVKDKYTWNTYKYMTDGMSDSKFINKYQIEDRSKSGIWYYENSFIGDGLATLERNDDAASVNWGGTWRTPTYEEWMNLLDTGRFIWTREGTGYRVTSKVPGYVGNSIYLPAAASVNNYLGGNGIYGLNHEGLYWSSSLDSTTTMYACYVLLDSPRFIMLSCLRFAGLTVRPVSD